MNFEITASMMCANFGNLQKEVEELTSKLEKMIELKTKNMQNIE